MIEKLQKILDDYSKDIDKYSKYRSELEYRLRFLKEHGFIEELRIAKIRYDSILLVSYQFENMHNEIQELLNKWES